MSLLRLLFILRLILLDAVAKRPNTLSVSQYFATWDWAKAHDLLSGFPGVLRVHVPPDPPAGGPSPVYPYKTASLASLAPGFEVVPNKAITIAEVATVDSVTQPLRRVGSSNNFRNALFTKYNQNIADHWMYQCLGILSEVRL